MLTHGSLFAGIGGFDLGFERAGIKTVWQVEIDEYCRRVLARHFPDAVRFSDIRDCGANNLERVDIISGGFPCQPNSLSGKRLGAADERWLWPEYLRILCELRPRIAVLENPTGLLSLEMGAVLRDLAASGFDAEWDCFPATAFGAYHERDRVFILAYAAELNGRPHDLLEAGDEWRASLQSRRFSCMAVAARAERENARLGCEPDLARMVRRVPAALDRLEGIGDAVHPAISEWIGRRIVEAMEATKQNP